MSTKTKRIAAFLMEVVMITFVFTYFCGVSAPKQNTRLSIGPTSADQLVLRNSGSSEFTSDLVAKLQFVPLAFKSAAIDIPSLEMATSTALLVNLNLHNPFYANTTIHAP